SILIVMPTVDPMATDFSKNRLDPMIAGSPGLAECFNKKRVKDASNTTLSKSFTGGFLAMAGANSAASLAARAVRFLALDEIDRYPLELAGEGNTISIAMKRTTSYRNRKRIIMTSSPTIEGAPIHSWYVRGDQRKFFVPCPECGRMHAYEWKNVKWERDDPTTARLHCPECDHGIDDAQRVAILSKGEWRATQPNRRERNVASFHVWEAYSPLSSLVDIVGTFIAARMKQKQGDKSEMHTFQNTTLAEPVAKDESTAATSNEILLMRRESVAAGIDVPEGACCLTMGVDTQDDRLELLIDGWGPGEESWVIERRTIPGDPARPEPWADLLTVLERPFRHAGGQLLYIQSTCIDSAGHRTNYVYDFAFKHAVRKVFATIGRDGNRTITSSPSQRRWGTDAREVPLYTIGVDAAKSLVIGRLAVTDKGPGYIHLLHKDWCDEEFIAQLNSEVLVTKMQRGFPIKVWKKIRTRNEGLDCAVGALAALRLLNPNLSVMAAELLRMSNFPGTPSPTGGSSGRRVGRSQYLG
ncbi:MAG TPA: terminase gpA endonuclease subunit, partial [Vicinamibacterales bacterium]|nr:terminase gpA endonuclease subunit [Vicinamibacterales bacterium]